MGNHRASSVLDHEDDIESRQSVADQIFSIMSREDYIPVSRRAVPPIKARLDVNKLINDFPLKRVAKIVLVVLALLFVISAVIAGIIGGIEKSNHSSAPAARVSNVAAVKPLAMPTATHTQIVHEPAKATVKTVTVTKTGPTVIKTVSVPGKVSTACQLTVTLAEDENKQFAIFEANYGNVKNVMDAAVYAIGLKDQALINKSINQMNAISIASNTATVNITTDQLQMVTAVADCQEGY